jgi:hypothetical protein
VLSGLILRAVIEDGWPVNFDFAATFPDADLLFVFATLVVVDGAFWGVIFFSAI